MNRIKKLVRSGEKEDIVRGAAIYLVMIFRKCETFSVK